MTNLWGVLLQTCSVSLVAGLLLGLKRVWKQTLSPRWQSALWGILAVRILFPVTMTGKFLLLPLPFWVETLKTVVEGHLSSSYTSFYEMTQVTAPIPWIAGLPSSVTDWLFLLYSFGVGVMLLRYLLAYLRLRCCLRLGHPAPLEVQRTVHEIGKRYALRVCRVVVLPGLSSPLVFGVLRPVMVLPEGTVDEAMLLHIGAIPWFSWLLTVRNWIWNPSVTSGCWSGWRGKRGGLTGIRFWLWPMAAILAFRGPLPWPTAAEISAGALR